jgi:hypothetical protein
MFCTFSASIPLPKVRMGRKFDVMFDYNNQYNKNSFYNFTPIQFDTSILAASYAAKLALSSASTAPPPPKDSSHGPAVIPPWKTEPQQTLNQRIVDARGVTNFIDLNSASVKSAGNDKDTKALFALYSALNKLKTIADYAADPNTVSGLLNTLNTQFQTGLSQVQKYIETADLSKLTLMFGEKSSVLSSTATLGKDPGSVTGNTVLTGTQDGVVPGLTGTEVFTLKVGTDSFNVDLSTLGQPLTLGNIAARMNQMIAAVPQLDASNNPVLDANGQPVSKYTTQIQVVAQGSGFALKVIGSSTEPVSFTAAVSDPSLYITGNYTPLGGGTGTGVLMQVADLNTVNPTTIFRETVAGLGTAPLVLPDPKATTPAKTPEAAPAETAANATVTDSKGDVYVVGQTKGDVGNIVNGASSQDVYLTKYDATGKTIWSRLLGASDSASGFAVTVDSQDNVIISGQSNSAVDGTTHVFSGNQAFVSKYSSEGVKAWTQQFDTLASTSGLAVTVEANNNIIVAGQTSGQLNNTTTYGGGLDAFVARLDSASGAALTTSQFGGAGSESARSVAVTSDGNIVVASNENGHAVVRKLSSADLSTVMYSVDLGTLSTGSVSAIKVSGNSIYVAGTTENTALAGTITAPSQGGSDGFVSMITDGGASGAASWTSYLGTAGTDQITGLQVSGGNVYVAGSTNSTLAGQVQSGSTDAIAAKIDGTTGAQVWAKQLGGVLGDTKPTGVAFSASGYSVLNKLGLSTGPIQTTEQRDIETQTSALAGQYFYITINGGAKQKITIHKGDTFQDLASRINMLSFLNIQASQSYSSKGAVLQIKPMHDATFQIFAGDGANDALPHLGMKPTKVLSATQLYDISTSKDGIDPNKLGGVFALSLQSNYHVLDKKAAAYVSNQLGNAINEVERAFRSLTYDPIKAQLLKQANNTKGTVPAYLTNQIASYSDALARLQAMNGQSTSA